MKSFTATTLAAIMLSANSVEAVSSELEHHHVSKWKR